MASSRLSIASLRTEYLAGRRRPVDVIEETFERLRAAETSPVWISFPDEQSTLARAKAIDLSLPLAGIPFAVKDNIDVAGVPTTAACPDFAYLPTQTATAVQRLLDAGAIFVGKTNMDQFATGLVGTRSPYGACSNAFDSRYISGGSSSGSAVAVAQGMCAFALGTDTAGSGRVPAAFNNLVGLKPTRGLVSTSGVVPACRSLDCVSFFTSTASDAETLWRLAQGFDADDPYSRTFTPGAGAAPWLGGAFRFGIPEEVELQFFGDTQSSERFDAAVTRMEQLGGTAVAIDFGPFRRAAALLYSGPWVAERLAAVGRYIRSEPDSVHETVREIILRGETQTAEDAYQGAYELESLKRLAAAQWTMMDFMLLPTAGTIYTKEAVAADPITLNTNLGYYTNFVNLMDLAAIAVPAGFRPDGLPFGVSLVGPAFSDPALIAMAQQFLGEPSNTTSPGCVRVAVVGAHLTDEPLNYQLRDRGARLVQSCRTSGEYRLFALKGSVPPKPGLLREPGYAGLGVEIEVWAIPEDHFGGFVASVPPPLAIGNVQLDSGEWVKGFVCEPDGFHDALEITSFGGWKTYRRSL